MGLWFSSKASRVKGDSGDTLSITREGVMGTRVGGGYHCWGLFDGSPSADALMQCVVKEMQEPPSPLQCYSVLLLWGN